MRRVFEKPFRGRVLLSPSAWVLAAATTFAGAGLWIATPSSAEAPGAARIAAVSPLVGAAKVETSWIEGRVDAVHQVPGYTYVEVTSQNGDTLVIATLKRDVAVGANVSARLVAQRTNFPSRHLGRTFPVLHFGVVTTSPTPALAGPPAP